MINYDILQNPRVEKPEPILPLNPSQFISMRIFDSSVEQHDQELEMIELDRVVNEKCPHQDRPHKARGFCKTCYNSLQVQLYQRRGELPSADIIRDLKFMQVFAIPATTTKDSSGKLRNSKILSSKEKAESLKGNQQRRILQILR